MTSVMVFAAHAHRSVGLSDDFFLAYFVTMVTIMIGVMVFIGRMSGARMNGDPLLRLLHLIQWVCAGLIVWFVVWGFTSGDWFLGVWNTVVFVLLVKFVPLVMPPFVTKLRSSLPRGKKTRYAWRSWHLDTLWVSSGAPPRRTPRLRSINGGCAWDRGVMEAECQCHGSSSIRVMRDWPGPYRNQLPPPPTPPCEHGTCGIYSRKFSTHLPHAEVVGIVAIGGKVVHASEGYRSQLAMPVALFVNEFAVSEEQANQLAAWYECPVQRGRIWHRGGIGFDRSTQRWVRKAGKQIVKEAVKDDDRFAREDQ